MDSLTHADVIFSVAVTIVTIVTIVTVSLTSWFVINAEPFEIEPFEIDILDARSSFMKSHIPNTHASI